MWSVKAKSIDGKSAPSSRRAARSSATSAMSGALAELIETDAQAPAALQPRQLRMLYLEEGEQERRKSARAGLWAAVAVYLLFLFPDILLIPDVAVHTIAARFAVGLTVLLVMEVQYRTGARTEWLDLTCAAALVSG